MGIEHVGSHGGRGGEAPGGRWDESSQQVMELAEGVARRRFAPRASAAGASRLDMVMDQSRTLTLGDLVDAEDVEDLADLGGDGDATVDFDEETELAAWRRLVGQGEPKLDRKLRGRLDSGGRVSAPTKASYLAHRMETLWREAELERRSHRSRLDCRSLPMDDAAFERHCGELKLRLAAHARRPASWRSSCLSCGSPSVEFPSALCQRCLEAEEGAHALALRCSCSRLPENHVSAAASEEEHALADPIDLFAKSEFGPDRDACPFNDAEPGPSKSDVEPPAKESWRRLFWLLALLVVFVGIAASVYGLDGVSPPLKGEAGHAGK